MFYSLQPQITTALLVLQRSDCKTVLRPEPTPNLGFIGKPRIYSNLDVDTPPHPLHTHEELINPPDEANDAKRVGKYSSMCKYLGRRLKSSTTLKGVNVTAAALWKGASPGSGFHRPAFGPGTDVPGSVWQR